MFVPIMKPNSTMRISLIKSITALSHSKKIPVCELDLKDILEVHSICVENAPVIDLKKGDPPYTAKYFSLISLFSLSSVVPPS